MKLTIDEHLLARILTSFAPCAPGPDSYEDLDVAWRARSKSVQRAYVEQAKRYITLLGRVTGQHKRSDNE